MIGIILAAGRGSRMKELTENIPKCFVKLKGKRLLDYQLEAMHEVGIDQITIIRGYADTCFDETTHYIDNLRWRETNMVYSLYCADALLSRNSAIVSYSDIVYPSENVSSILNSPHDITIAYDPNWLTLWRSRFADVLSDAESFVVGENNKLLEIGACVNMISQIKGQYMGLFLIRPTGWQTIKRFLQSKRAEQIDKMDMTSLFGEMIKNGDDIYAIPVSMPWYEVDTQHDLAIYENLKDLW